MMYKAVVKNKETKKLSFIESEYSNKSDFIYDLRHNGYMVNPDKVQPTEVFEYIIENTNCHPWDWKSYKLDKNGNIIKVDVKYFDLCDIMCK